ncbi:DEAD/DEAH box helicase [Anaerorhabdus sp.]|uniref:DEAD/DEAH box helicase n=1 Tax=Anaerorhabdus sp. TaxID=1872524 RepID=UPI002FC7C9E9
MYLTSLTQFHSLMKSDQNKKIAERIYDKDNYIEVDITNTEPVVACGVFEYYGTFNHATVTVNTETETIDSFSCDCRWCSKENPCAHVGALVLRMSVIDHDELPYFYDTASEDEELDEDIHPFLKPLPKPKINAPMDLDYYANLRLERNSKALIDSLRESIRPLVVSPSEKISLVPQVIPYQSHYYEPVRCVLELKIGYQKPYVVKNINQLLTQIEQHDYANYGKNFASYLNIEFFDEDSQKLIQFLMKYRYLFRAMPTNNLRHFPLSEPCLEDFYELLLSMDDMHGIELNEDESPCELEFSPFGTGYSLNLKPNRIMIVNGHSYSFHDKTLTRHIFKNPTGILRLYNAFGITANQLNMSDVTSFYHLCLVDILDDLHLINFPQHLLSTNEIHRIELYGDLNNRSDLEISIHYIKNDGSKTYAFTQNTKVDDLNAILVENFVRDYAYSIDTDNHKAFLDMNKDRTYDFIKSGLDKLKEHCDVFVSEALKSIGTPKHYAINLGVRVDAGILELDISSTDIPLSELSDVLKNYKRRKKFHRLKNGELLYLESDELNEIEGILESNHLSTDDLKEGKVQLPLYRSFQTNEALSNLNTISIARSDSFKDCLTSFNLQNHHFDIDPSYLSTLRDYQIVGVQWMALLHSYGFNGILADDMGLGKTLQVITLIDSLKPTKPTLVVCPASLILNWQDEVEKFSSSLSCLAIHGSAEYRASLIHDIHKYNICVTSYDYVRRDIELLKEIDFEYIILDEAQYIKNHNTKNAQSTKALKAQYRLALTGTPIENSLAELWSIFDYLMPNYLYNYHYFRKNFEVPIVKDQDEEVQVRLKRMVEPFILRRLKTEVLKELPDKLEQTIKIDFNDDEEKLYLAHAVQVASSIEKQLKANKFDKIQVLSMITKLRQLCSEPRVLFENIDVASSKMNACMDIITTFKENKKKVLLFSSFTSIFPFIIKELKREKIKYHVLTGETDKTLRRQLVQDFQSDDSTVFLISLKAGGTGLNLTAAEGVIHFDPWWNISAQNQATDRSHRIGQKNIVQVYKLIMKNTIEEKIIKLQETKKNLADTFVENNEGTISQLSPEQLLDLFK